MPCYYTGSAEGDAKLGQSEALKELQKVTRLLCKVCRDAEARDAELPASVWKWWLKHQEQDKKGKQ